MQEKAQQNAGLAPQPESSQNAEEKAQIDARSVYVGNVDYAVTPEELQMHFQVMLQPNNLSARCLQALLAARALIRSCRLALHGVSLVSSAQPLTCTAGWHCRAAARSTGSQYSRIGWAIPR